MLDLKPRENCVRHVASEIFSFISGEDQLSVSLPGIICYISDRYQRPLPCYREVYSTQWSVTSIKPPSWPVGNKSQNRTLEWVVCSCSEHSHHWIQRRIQQGALFNRPAKVVFLIWVLDTIEYLKSTVGIQFYLIILEVEAPGWLGLLGVWLFVSAEVMVLGLWDWALLSAQSSCSSPCAPSCSCSLSFK